MRLRSKVLVLTFVLAMAPKHGIAVPIELSCDYNENGFCDAADFVVWRDTNGQHLDLRADGDGNSHISQADYDVWTAGFGSAVGSYSGPRATSVPEPTSLTSSIMALLFGTQLRRRQRRRIWWS